MLNDCFFSIVQKDCKRDELMVRARRPGDIEKVFPEMDGKVTEFTASDYHYRAAIGKDRIKEALANEIDRVIYSNFKSSVDDRPLHDAYVSVWHAMARLQPQKPYAGVSRQRGASLFDFEHSSNRVVPGLLKAAKTKAKPAAKAKK
jgi:hypothetical protein